MEEEAHATMNSICNLQSAICNEFTAILIAGGRSKRMGRDKAALLIDGEPLWKRQLETLRATGAVERLISGRSDGPYASAGVPVIEDLTPGAGPLAALEAALAKASTPFVVVLGIDMPAMRPDFLSALMRRECSVIPVAEDGWFEPLAAVYARDLAPLVTQCLRGEDRSMQHFIRTALDAGLAITHPISPAERALFQNLNSPEDLALQSSPRTPCTTADVNTDRTTDT